MTKNLTLALTLLLALAACSTDDYTTEHVQSVRHGVSVSARKPLAVYAGLDGTRATVVTTGRNGLTGFRLFGYHHANTANAQDRSGFFLGSFLYLNPDNIADTLVGGTGNGIVYSKDNDGKWHTEGISAWPKDSISDNDFYGVAVQGLAPDTVADNDRDDDGTAINMTATTVDFLEMENDQPQFSYTVPPTVGKQKDLLLSTVSGVRQSDKFGAIVLSFKHALSNVTLQLRFDGTGDGKQSDTQTSIASGYEYAIDTITFHNIYNTGTYNFANQAWTVPSGSPVDIKVVYGKSNPKLITAGSTTTFADLIQGDSSIMIIPQTVNVADVSTSGFTSGNKSYIEVHGICWNPNQGYTKRTGNRSTTYRINGNETPFNVTGDDLDNLRLILNSCKVIAGDLNSNDLATTRGSTSVYFAFPDDFKFEYNKSYNIRLNIYKGHLSDGSSAL